MDVVKAFVFRIGHYILSFIRILRKVFCCRRKKQVEHVLPMTIGDISEVQQVQETAFETPEFKTQWDTWPSAEMPNVLNYQVPRTDSDTDSQTAHTEEDNHEDFFKDMVPQIRKQKKILIRNSANEIEPEQGLSNRLAMDPNRIIMGPELGVIDDNPCNWENNEDSEDAWDPDVLIREKKRAEQEKRRAEHQRRKQEKENRKLSKPESLSSRIMSMSDTTKDKDKYS